MAGSIAKVVSQRTGKVTWRARYRDAGGDQHETRHKRRADAQAWLEQQSSAMLTGTHSAPARSRVTVKDMAEAWLGVPVDEPETSRAKRRWIGGPVGLTPSTVARYRGLWITHVQPTWGHVKLNAVEHGDVAEWVTKLSGKRSASTTRAAHRVLALILQEAVHDRRLSINPAARVRLPRLEKRHVDPLPIPQVRALMDAAGDYDDLILVLAILGLRFGELAALRVEDLSLEDRHLRIERSTTEVSGHLVPGDTKTHQARWVPVPSFLFERLSKRVQGRAPEDYMFLSPRGCQVRLNNWRRNFFRPAVEAAGIDPDLRVHDLRHSAVSLAVAAGADAKLVQRMVGHASATMTQDTYLHIFPKRMEGLVERMDEIAGDAFQ